MSVVRLKDGVNPSHLTPEMGLGLLIVACAYDFHGYDCIPTSMYDGTHGANTLHQRDGKCNAVDFRTKHVSREVLDQLVHDIKANLGLHYDVVLESRGEANEHLHVEFDPKLDGANRSTA